MACITYVCYHCFLKLFYTRRKKDEKILKVILQAVGDHPDELKYQRLNIKKLSKLFNNCALALDFLLKLGFDYTSSKAYLKFIGSTKFQRTESALCELLDKETISPILMQCAIQACARVKEIQEIQETHKIQNDIVEQVNDFLEVVCM